jgi:predicted DsbA family dithiol-disulfide isomerase
MRTGKTGRQAEFTLTIIATLVAAGAGFLVAARPRPAAPIVTSQVAAFVTGELPHVPVVRIFDDFQCPACARFDKVLSPRLGELERQGRIRIVYVHAPIRSHTRSRFAAAAVACTDVEARSALRSRLHADAAWILADQPDTVVARIAGGNANEAFLNCVASDSTARRLRDEELFASRGGIRSVPTVWVDNAHVRFSSYESLLRYIEERL